MEEQTKGGNLKETIRLKEVELRRSEQEVDSLTFRNKQLELRVATLQDELEKKQGRTGQKKATLHSNGNHNSHPGAGSDNVVTEEFQKKIVENAQLISLLADKSHELELCTQQLQELEEKVNSQVFKQSFVESSLRNEIQELLVKNSSLEMRLMELGRVCGTTSDDDNRSITTDNSSLLADTAPISCGGGGAEDRIVALERELNLLRAKYEVLQEKSQLGDGEDDEEQILFGHFSHRVDEILQDKQLAESKLISFMGECEGLKDQLEVLTDELRDQERQLNESQRNVKRVEDHLQTTRYNYEEQISVLTEQVLSLSDQLAAASN